MRFGVLGRVVTIQKRPTHCNKVASRRLRELMWNLQKVTPIRAKVSFQITFTDLS